MEPAGTTRLFSSCFHPLFPTGNIVFFTLRLACIPLFFMALLSLRNSVLLSSSSSFFRRPALRPPPLLTGLLVVLCCCLSFSRSHSHSTGLRLITPLSAAPLYSQAVTAAGVRLLSWEELLQIGADKPREPVPPSPDDLCTIMYTSGTTGGQRTS